MQDPFQHGLAALNAMLGKDEEDIKLWFDFNSEIWGNVDALMTYTSSKTNFILREVVEQYDKLILVAQQGGSMSLG